jgi:hypothetical protein
LLSSWAATPAAFASTARREDLSLAYILVSRHYFGSFYDISTTGPMRECPVLHATLDDIRKPFEAFIEKHEKKIAQAGIAKIVVPEGWTPRRQVSQTRPE